MKYAIVFQSSKFWVNNSFIPGCKRLEHFILSKLDFHLVFFGWIVAEIDVHQQPAFRLSTGGCRPDGRMRI